MEHRMYWKLIWRLALRINNYCTTRINGYTNDKVLSFGNDCNYSDLGKIKRLVLKATKTIMEERA